MSREEFEKTLSLNPVSMQGAVAKWIKQDGTTIDVSPKDGKSFSLEELQLFVGGYAQGIGFENQILFCDEDGLHKAWNVTGKAAYKINEEASKIYNEWFSRDDLELYGDVLITPSTMVK
jgi:hypothetical protein